jgi:hypothetical protein
MLSKCTGLFKQKLKTFKNLFLSKYQMNISWGYVKDLAFVPPLPRNLGERKEKIVAAMSTIENDMLRRACDELDYRIDMCRVTRGAHIEHS